MKQEKETIESGRWEDLPRIFSRQNEGLKAALKLKSRRGAKKQQGMLLEGWKAIGLAQKLGAKIEAIFVADNDAGRAWYESCYTFTKDSNFYALAENLYRELALTQTPTQPVAVIKRPEQQQLSKELLHEHRRILLLDRIQDPGNLGTLIRTAAAFDFTLLLLTAGSASVFQEKVWRGAMGSLGAITCLEGLEVTQLLELFEAVPHRLVAADIKGKALATDTLIKPPYCLVLGNEGGGIDPCLLDRASEVLKIPMSEGAESLNVAAAGAIFCYQLRCGEN